jgi:dipeptidyl aminopeptidase/acylaminoacyl peptidase
MIPNIPAPEAQWDQTFGGALLDYGEDVEQTSDGGYIVAGRTASFGHGSTDGWLIRTDSWGGEVWEDTKVFGGPGADRFEAVEQTSDGGYIAAGTFSSYSSHGNGGFDAWLVKTDSDGNEMWQKYYGGSGHDGEIADVQQTSDGGYVMVGETNSFGAGDFDIWVVRTEADGNVRWGKSFGGQYMDVGYSVRQTSDGGYIVSGMKGYNYYHEQLTKADLWLIKLDSEGNEEWNRAFGDSGASGYSYGSCVRQTADGGYIVAGGKGVNGTGVDQLWLIKTDNSGNKEWAQEYGGSNAEIGNWVQQTSDGGYIVSGSTRSYGAGDYDIWLIETDGCGYQVWDNPLTFGGSGSDIGQTVKQTTDGGYIVTGRTQSFGNGSDDVWLIKIRGTYCGKVIFSSTRDGNSEVYAMNPDGSGSERLTFNPASDGEARFSPDGTKIAFMSNRAGNLDIYVMNADGTGETRLTDDPSHDVHPAWSPGGDRIAFHTYRDGDAEIYVMNADGSGQMPLTSNDAGDFDAHWSPDGSQIAFWSDRDGNWEVYVMNADGTAQTNLSNGPAKDFHPSWSPDGTRIAFSSTRDGNHEVYVMNADGSGQTRLTSDASSDAVPGWSPDGTRIVFQSDRFGDYEIVVMDAVDRNADGEGDNMANLTNRPGDDYSPSWAGCPVANQPPMADAGGPYLSPVNVAVVVDGGASTDPDGGPLEYRWDFESDGIWDTTWSADSSATATYASPGIYDLTLAIRNSECAVDTDTVMAIVYDPAAGFATGGGWFIPGKQGDVDAEDDYLPGLDSTSKATFGFVVKYKNGAAETPSGQLEFQYRVGDFNLHSGDYDWLVVTNSNWAKFQGVATIKGMGGLFPFRVDCRDGDANGGSEADRFVIKIWAPGADPDVDELIYKASGDLSGGQIKIHKQ